MQQSEGNQKKPAGNRGILIRNLILIAGIVLAVGITVWFAQQNKEEVPQDGYFSEEQAAARLATLEAAQKEKPAEVIPMQFFMEELRPDTGTFELTAVTTMPEANIVDASFLVTSASDPEVKKWYDGDPLGNGYYKVNGSVADLGNKEGTYKIQAYITPKGGSETEAGSAEIDIRLIDYFYSEALGGGRQSLVLVHPSAGMTEETEPEESETEEGSEEETPETDTAETGEQKSGTDTAETEEEISETEAEGAEEKTSETGSAESEEKTQETETSRSDKEKTDTETAGSDEEKPDTDTTEPEKSKPKLSGVTFKVWTEEGGQEDMSVYKAEEKGENIWYAEIALEDFAYRGDFVANAYAVIGDVETGIASAGFELLPEPMEIPEGKGHVVREGKRVYVEVPEILQNPELPTGCESVALTIVLNSMGYSLEKTEIAKNYLPRGDNLATTYVGDPFSQQGAGCFPPAIASTASDYLIEHGDSRRGHNITGTSMEDLFSYIENGTPVILWSSSYMAYPSHSGNIVTFHGQSYEWYSSEHCLVLYGYDKEKGVCLVSDPLVGLVERDRTAFENIYNEIGKYAVVIY